MIYHTAITLNQYITERHIVLAHGCWDILHIGHVRHLREASRLASTNTRKGALVVSVTADEFVDKGPDRPHFTVEERAEVIAAIKWVDYVIVNYAPDAVDLIKVLRPNVYVKGAEYVDRIMPGLALEMDAVRECGGQVEFIGKEICHSTELLQVVV